MSNSDIQNVKYVTVNKSVSKQRYQKIGNNTIRLKAWLSAPKIRRKLWDMLFSQYKTIRPNNNNTSVPILAAKNGDCIRNH